MGFSSAKSEFSTNNHIKKSGRLGSQSIESIWMIAGKGLEYVDFMVDLRNQLRTAAKETSLFVRRPQLGDEYAKLNCCFF